jgi:hypothetical protein
MFISSLSKSSGILFIISCTYYAVYASTPQFLSIIRVRQANGVDSPLEYRSRRLFRICIAVRSTEREREREDKILLLMLSNAAELPHNLTSGPKFDIGSSLETKRPKCEANYWLGYLPVRHRTMAHLSGAPESRDYTRTSK